MASCYSFTHIPTIASRALILQGLILGVRPAHERRRYLVTTSLIAWVHA